MPSPTKLLSNLRFRPARLGAWAFVFALDSFGADWPQFRGPDRNDISQETGLLKAWPAGGPKLAWRTTGLGGGLSGVSVAAGRVYTMGEDAERCYVRALDETTGRLLWSAKVGAIGGGQQYHGPRCTPSVDGNLLFALGQFGDLVCVEWATGKEVWRVNLEKDLGGKMKSGWGYSESPLVDGDQVICSPGGAKGVLVALQIKTGKIIWRSAEWTDKAAYSSVVAATVCGMRQYVQLTGASVGGVNPADGKLLWKAARPGKTAVISTPVIDGDFVYVTSGYDVGCNLFHVEKTGGKLTGREVYANKEIKNHHGGVVKIGDHVFGFSDGAGWVWQDLKTGKPVLVGEQRKLGKGSLTVADGMLYLRLESGKGTVVLLDSTPTGWNENGRFDQPDRSDKNSWPHPVVANGRLYLRDQDVLLAYDVKRR